MAAIRCLKCGKVCKNLYYKVSPRWGFCPSCYKKIFREKPETVTISYPPEDK